MAVHPSQLPDDKAVEEVRYLWGALTATFGAGVRRPALHLACEHIERAELERRFMAAFSLLRVVVQEAAEARGLDLDDYLAEKGLNLALMAERRNSAP